MSVADRGRGGMRIFTVVWIGQVVSLLGSSMTAFALGIWAWQVTGKATPLALTGFFYMGPLVLLGPIAGALVDRWDRRLTMMLSDLAAGLSTLALLALYAGGNLQIWHIYAASAFSGLFQAFQFPAYSAAITTMLPKAQYARANGMLSIAQAGSTILGPPLAALLLGLVDLVGVMLLDVASFVVAIGALLLVRIPKPVRTEAGREGQGNLLKEAAYGFRYILERPSLLALQLVFTSGNLLFSLVTPLLVPMILARTGGDEMAAGSLQAVLGFGALAGAVLLSAWGGPQRRIYGVLGGWACTMVPLILFGLGTATWVWAASAFGLGFFGPIINGSNQAIWQAKVAPDVQGRVFSVRGLIAQVTAPLGMLLAGPLADRIFEPAMASGSGLATLFGGLVTPGSGAGMGLMMALAGAAGLAVSVVAYSLPLVRNVEDSLPDHEMAVEPTVA